MGDSSYVYFNSAAKAFQERFEQLGAKCVMQLGIGDEKDEDKLVLELSHNFL
jgi:sulfite reductase alpha subunit-like flavoprotein